MSRNMSRSATPGARPGVCAGQDGCPRRDSNARSRLRRAVLYPLSYGGSGLNEDSRYVDRDPAGPGCPARRRPVRQPPGWVGCCGCTSCGLVPVTVMPCEQVAPFSGPWLRSALMKSSIRPSLASSSLSWKPQACTEIGVSSPLYGLINMYSLPFTRLASAATWSFANSGWYVIQMAPCSRLWTACSLAIGASYTSPMQFCQIGLCVPATGGEVWNLSLPALCCGCVQALVLEL